MALAEVIVRVNGCPIRVITPCEPAEDLKLEYLRFVQDLVVSMLKSCKFLGLLANVAPLSLEHETQLTGSLRLADDGFIPQPLHAEYVPGEKIKVPRGRGTHKSCFPVIRKEDISYEIVNGQPTICLNQRAARNLAKKVSELARAESGGPGPVRHGNHRVERRAAPYPVNHSDRNTSADQARPADEIEDASSSFWGCIYCGAYSHSQDMGLIDLHMTVVHPQGGQSITVQEIEYAIPEDVRSRIIWRGQLRRQTE